MTKTRVREQSAGEPVASWASSSPTLPRFGDLPLEDRWYLVTIVGFFSQSILLTVGAAIETFVPLVTAESFTIAVIFLPFCLYLISRLSDRKAIHLLPFVGLYVLLLAYMMLSVSLHPKNADVMFDAEWDGNIYSVLFTPLAPIVAFLMITAAPSTALLFRGFQYAAYLLFMGNIFRLGQATVRGSWTTFNSAGTEIETSYDLGFGYSVLFSVIVFMFLAFASHYFYLHLAGVVAGLAMILTNGSRAPLAIAVGALVLLAFYFRRKLFLRSPVRFVILIFSVVGLIVIVANIDRILLAVQSWLKAMGVESRTFEKLTTDTFTEDRARDILGRMSTELIASGGPFGHGLFGDRYFIRDRFRWGYPHNIVDEILITYGVLIGAIVMVAILAFIVYAVARGRGTIHNDLIVLLIPMTFQLWVSLSYLLSVWFWALLGACWLALRHSKPRSSVPAHRGR